MRTSFEFARLLYSLDPWTDPHGALLHLDYLAHKAGMTQWLLDVWDFFSKSSDDGGFRNRLRPTVLPGWAYARALALFTEEESKKQACVVLCSSVPRKLTLASRITRKAQLHWRRQSSLSHQSSQSLLTRLISLCLPRQEGTRRSACTLTQGMATLHRQTHALTTR